VLVNKQNALADWDIPDDLVEAHIPFVGEQDLPRRLLRRTAARAAERMFDAARADGLQLSAVSAFRSYSVQDAVFRRTVNDYGGDAQAANFGSALPGQSEHQTGLALDITSASIGYRLDAGFGQTPEGLWLQKNASRYGFILRYPQGKESVTRYKYEPWHWRYVGRQAAEEMLRSGSVLEEYRAAQKLESMPDNRSCRAQTEG
jgi:D-alanyl-D-alanine carboxypeptidase